MMKLPKLSSLIDLVHKAMLVVQAYKSELISYHATAVQLQYVVYQGLPTNTATASLAATPSPNNIMPAASALT